MKKVLSIVLALVFVLGFASMATAMGPSGADPSTNGFFMSSFVVSDTLLSPLMVQNWSGTMAPNKTYAEGSPIWFVASFVQHKDTDDLRDFTSRTTTAPNNVRPGGTPGDLRSVAGIRELTAIFTSKDNCVNYSYSSGYMNFTQIESLQVVGGTVGNLTAGTGSISATATQLDVTFVAAPGGTPGNATSAMCQQLQVADAAMNKAGNYYLQIMAFTNACNEAQGTAIAKMPVDVSEFATVPASGLLADDAAAANVSALNSPVTTWLNVYDANNAVKYSVAKYRFATGYIAGHLANIGAKAGDNLYMVYDGNGDQVIGFVSSGSAYRGMVKVGFDSTGAYDGLLPVQYTSDAGGKYAFTANGTIVGGSQSGTEAISKGDLEALMTFFNFSFGNSYPVLDKHFHAFAGYWQVLEAKYNVAAAVINVPDPGVDIVPKTGDASTAFGMIMVAIAGLAAVGFVMMKRVRG